MEAARLWKRPRPISAAPKFARYPEWMRAFSLAGLYVPWTAEALCDPTAPASGQPFTAEHELMHMGGVADEGQANICAYIACQRYGGIFAASPDLWALKYAMDALRPLDADAWSARLAALDGAARDGFFALGGAFFRVACGGICPAPGRRRDRRPITARWPRGWRRVLYERIEKRAH